MIMKDILRNEILCSVKSTAILMHKDTILIDILEKLKLKMDYWNVIDFW